MKHYAFILSMPGRNSWNGKWTGDERLYCRCLSLTNEEDKKKVFTVDSYGYNFGDGWYASIEVKEVTSKEKAALIKNSKGFAGYDWMVTSIARHNEIIPPSKNVVK